MGINSTVNLRDYRDAALIYTSNNQFNMPKLKRWFHVYFEVDNNALNNISASLATAVQNGSINWIPGTTNNYGILGIFAKTVQLPNFKFTVNKGNQYNRHSLTVTKMDYQPVSITFYDDATSIVKDFWYGYYQYMIQDPKYAMYTANQTQGVTVPIQWQPSNGQFSSLYASVDDFNSRFGLDTSIAGSTAVGRQDPFFRSIRIYQFSRSTATDPRAYYDEYVLVNPVITSFGHEQSMDYAADDSTGHSMDIEYETVLYNEGRVVDLASWSILQDRNYVDTTPSPLSAGQPSNTLQNNSNPADQVTQVSGNLTNSPAVSIISTSPPATNAATSVYSYKNSPSIVNPFQFLNKQISVPGTTEGS